MTKKTPFSRPTVIAAANLLTDFTQKEFDNLMIQFGLEDRIDAGPGMPKQYKANALAKIALGEPDQMVETSTGEMSLVEAMIRQAMTVPPRAQRGEPWASFCNGLKRDGFVLVENDEERTTELRRMLPETAELAAADDEVHTLLRQHGFATPLGHLQQAIDAHGRGHWAAANSQLRTFLEGLLDEIAERLAPERAARTASGHGRRALLASLDPPFLSRGLNEWRDDQKPGLINGLFNRLHPEGSHPGLSDEEDSTFRLHMVLIVARLLLRRFSATAR
jgi:hypothetical protein